MRGDVINDLRFCSKDIFHTTITEICVQNENQDHKETSLKKTQE